MPIGESLITKALGDLAMGSLRTISHIEPDGATDIPDIWSVTINDLSGEITGILTNRQAEDVANFLSSFQVRNIFQAHFLCRLSATDKKTLTSIIGNLRETFIASADHWCADSETPWNSHATDFWENIDSYLESALPAQRVLQALSPAELHEFRNQIGGDPATAKTRKGIPRFLRHLVEMSLDLDRLIAIKDNVADIRRHITEHYSQIRLEHSQQDFRIQIDKLYIDRDLTDPLTKNIISSSAIFRNQRKARLVVTGDPGVGKSTFTEYLIRQLAEGTSDTWTTPLIIHCREYASRGTTSIIDLLRDKISNTLHLRFSENEIEDILTLGRGFIIVDGVDEILDLGRRRSLVRSIETLTKRFPLCSVIATTRNIGYSQAQFDSALFTRYELRSFTNRQVREYATRWFTLTKRSDSELSKFLIELESIPDLRRNPLMLSLLCILYKARGYIPRNRRQIYSQCADLLFNRWDSMRHIEQPYDHQHYGDELMQEIASWFYKSQAAQAGLEEQQIRKVIATFLVDTAAVPELAAEKRAGAFLDFCADRAWLLGTAGVNDRDQRIFVFTHRTFMEFFAAESLVRNSEIANITSEVARIFDRDSSSVLPDLIVQSAEVHRRGGARQIIDGLLERGKTLGKKSHARYLPLCLRIINLSPVSPRLMDDVFSRTLTEWSVTSPHASFDSTIAVLNLYRDPRARFMNMLDASISCMTDKACPDAHPHPFEEFIARWANVCMADLAVEYEAEWAEYVDSAIQRTIPHLIASSDKTLTHYLIEAGYIAPPKTGVTSLGTLAFDKSVAGYSFRSLERILRGVGNNYDDHIVGDLGSLADQGASFRASLALMLDTVTRDRTSQLPSNWITDTGTTPQSAACRNILLWICCATYEAYGHRNSFHDSIEAFMGIQFEQLFDTRENNIDKRSRRYGLEVAPTKRSGAQILTATDIKELSKTFPSWLPRWCRGTYNLIYQEPGQD
ncbi:NACHT domain-containing protein [Sphaerisporangium dianthi]|uniref:NACHT domain-containing protein n=1 Tax=Sphaerisporangium dianthi TaxID=1436120 RepID=A0ABV9CQY4_9ACTN